MALDYHIRSRTADVNAVAAAELTNLNGDADAKTAAIQVRTIATTNVKKKIIDEMSVLCVSTSIISNAFVVMSFSSRKSVAFINVLIHTIRI